MGGRRVSDELATLTRDMRGATARGAAFCRSCRVDGAAGISDAEFTVLPHQRLCPVRLVAERDAARAAMAQSEARASALSEAGDGIVEAFRSPRMEVYEDYIARLGRAVAAYEALAGSRAACQQEAGE